MNLQSVRSFLPSVSFVFGTVWPHEWQTNIAFSRRKILHWILKVFHAQQEPGAGVGMGRGCVKRIET
jgi:hypothetical protein